MKYILTTLVLLSTLPLYADEPSPEVRARALLLLASAAPASCCNADSCPCGPTCDCAPGDSCGCIAGVGYHWANFERPENQNRGQVKLCQGEHQVGLYSFNTGNFYWRKKGGGFFDAPATPPIPPPAHPATDVIYRNVPAYSSQPTYSTGGFSGGACRGGG